MRRIIFPGSFDPITNGHDDILKRAIPLFDEILIAVGVNVDKSYMFSIKNRMEFINSVYKNENKIKIRSYEGLTVDFCKKNNISYILRGLRNPSDFEFEKTMAHLNNSMSQIETIFLLTSLENSFISSSLVREIIKNGGDYSPFVPKSLKIKGY
jgi:pantetheine-phosphate adenylyltransferase